MEQCLPRRTALSRRAAWAWRRSSRLGNTLLSGQRPLDASVQRLRVFPGLIVCRRCLCLCPFSGSNCSSGSARDGPHLNPMPCGRRFDEAVPAPDFCCREPASFGLSAAHGAGTGWAVPGSRPAPGPLRQGCHPRDGPEECLTAPPAWSFEGSVTLEPECVKGLIRPSGPNKLLNVEPEAKPWPGGPAFPVLSSTVTSPSSHCGRAKACVSKACVAWHSTF